LQEVRVGRKAQTGTCPTIRPQLDPPSVENVAVALLVTTTGIYDFLKKKADGLPDLENALETKPCSTAMIAGMAHPCALINLLPRNAIGILGLAVIVAASPEAGDQAILNGHYCRNGAPVRARRFPCVIWCRDGLWDGQHPPRRMTI